VCLSFGTETKIPISTCRIINPREMWEIKSYFTSVLKKLEVVFLTNITSISVKAEVMKEVLSLWLMNIS